MNPYVVLEVDRDATAEDIRKAYKKKAMKYHPDKNPGNEQQASEMFKRVAEAYELLNDPQSRQKHDTDCMNASSMPAGAPTAGRYQQQVPRYDSAASHNTERYTSNRANSFNSYSMGRAFDIFDMLFAEMDDEFGAFQRGARNGNGFGSVSNNSSSIHSDMADLMMLSAMMSIGGGFGLGSLFGDDEMWGSDLGDRNRNRTGGPVRSTVIHISFSPSGGAVIRNQSTVIGNSRDVDSSNCMSTSTTSVTKTSLRQAGRKSARSDSLLRPTPTPDIVSPRPTPAPDIIHNIDTRNDHPSVKKRNGSDNIKSSGKASTDITSLREKESPATHYSMNERQTNVSSTSKITSSEVSKNKSSLNSTSSHEDAAKSNVVEGTDVGIESGNVSSRKQTIKERNKNTTSNRPTNDNPSFKTDKVNFESSESKTQAEKSLEKKKIVSEPSPRPRANFPGLSNNHKAEETKQEVAGVVPRKEKGILSYISNILGTGKSNKITPVLS